MDQRNVYFYSKRLEFKKPIAWDFDAIEKWFADSEIMKFQGGPWVDKQKDDIFEFIKWHWDTFNFGHFVAYLKEENIPIGVFSLKYLNKNPDLKPDLKKDRPDLGYFLAKEHWNKGFATEGAKALAKYGLSDLHLPEIGALNYPENIDSAKVLQKVGFKKLGETEVIYHGRNFGKAVNWTLSLKNLLE